MKEKDYKLVVVKVPHIELGNANDGIRLESRFKIKAIFESSYESYIEDFDEEYGDLYTNRIINRNSYSTLETAKEMIDVINEYLSIEEEIVYEEG